MGMYDSLMLIVKCPFCGQEEERECQTKDMDSELRIFRKGDFILDNVNSLSCICECDSKECWDQRDNFGLGIGKFFYIKAEVKDRVITGEYLIVDEED